MGTILSVIQQRQAGFMAPLAYWLDTGLSVTNLTCCLHPKDRTAEFCRIIRPCLALITGYNLVTVPISVHTDGN
jgi:hypothetical protein